MPIGPKSRQTKGRSDQRNKGRKKERPRQHLIRMLPFLGVPSMFDSLEV